LTVPEQEPDPALDVAAIYAKNAQFMWKSLSRAGVPDGDLPDALQEVLLVVHRRLDSFDGRSRLTTWLFGICLRVAATTRRRNRRRREEIMDPKLPAHGLIEPSNPEDLALARDAKRRLDLALDRLDPEKRAVLVMFELEGLSCAEIAELVGVPKGTIFSRLASARQTFLLALQRLESTEQRAVNALAGTR
jgi:RNA polymerase sigma-70 factor (ECF subfamily)